MAERWQRIGEEFLDQMEQKLSPFEIRKLAIAILAAQAVGKNKQMHIISEHVDQSAYSLYETVSEMCVKMGIKS